MHQEKELLQRSQSQNAVYYKLKWHKVQVVLLWVWAISSLGQSSSYFSGIVWGENMTAIYKMYPQVIIFDRLYGAYGIVSSIVSIFAAIKLSKFKSIGVTALKLLFISVIVAYSLYNFALGNAAGVSFLNAFTDTQFVGWIIGRLIWFIPITIYYNKRVEIFE